MSSFSQTNTTNPLNIKRIARQRIGLIVYRDPVGRPTRFAVNSLDLDGYGLTDSCEVKLFVYTKSQEQRLSLGSVRQPLLETQHDFSIDTGQPFHFRLIVCEPRRPDIIASCEGLRANEDTDEVGRQPLLPVEPSDNLGEKLWEVRVDDDAEPVLYVNSDETIGMIARVRGDPVFQALILPQAVEQVARELIPHLGDEEGWHGRWNRYLAARGIEPPDDPDEDESCTSWARLVAQKFSGEHQFATRLRTFIEERGDVG